MKLVSWNVNGITSAWDGLPDDVDVALLQEAPRPPDHIDYTVYPAVEGAWRTTGWIGNLWQRSTAIAAPSGKYRLRPYPLHTLEAPVNGGIAVSRLGALAVCDVLDADDRVMVTVASAYAFWMHSLTNERLIFSDASAHAILSELSPLLPDARSHRVILAGDWNLLYGYSEGENSDRDYWRGRYASVFARAEALGLKYVGPHAPNGRQADPWPTELPADSQCVPTYHTRTAGPTGASRQLDHVFASAPIADRVAATALNDVGDWGPSDHCRIQIDLAG